MRRELVTCKTYEKAFACQKGDPCPQKVGEEGCPMWCEVIKTTLEGEEIFLCGCYPQMSLISMVEVIKASNRPAAAVESTRNEIVKGFERISENLIYAAQTIKKPLPAKGFFKRMLGKGE